MLDGIIKQYEKDYIWRHFHIIVSKEINCSHYSHNHTYAWRMYIHVVYFSHKRNLMDELFLNSHKCLTLEDMKIF